MTSEQSAPPARLGGYQVHAKIADGGMATIYVAERTDGPSAGRKVAIKMIRDEFARNHEFITMFTDEANIIGGLRHPNIVRYHELGFDSGQVFLAMDLLVGQSLWNLWETSRVRETRIRYDLIAWIGARVADGLHYAHEFKDERGNALEIVHRDVNATNIFVTYDGDIKIIDFGLAKAANRASKTAAGIIKGKVAYMSPEQAVGAPIDRRTDIFALGTTLWELACNRRLFKQPDEVETLRKVHAADVPDPTQFVPGFPPRLWRILQRALAREKRQRYQTAAELGRDLDSFVDTFDVDAAGRPTGGIRRSGAAEASPVRALLAQTMREIFADDFARQVAWGGDLEGLAGGDARIETTSAHRCWSETDEQTSPMVATFHAASGTTDGAARKPLTWASLIIATTLVMIALLGFIVTRGIVMGGMQ